MPKLVALVVLFLASTATAAPAYIPVQGFLTDAGDAPLAGQHQIRLTIYDADLGGSALFTETQTVAVVDGLVVIYLGGVTALDLALFRDHGAAYLGMAIDSDPEMTPRFAMGSVPFAGYAAYAGEAESLAGLAATDFRLAADPDADTLASLSCNEGDVAKYSGGAWVCLPDIDTVLTDAEVAAMVSDDGYALAAALADGNSATTPVSWLDLTGVPADIADGDLDTQLSEAQVETFITNGALDLAAGTTLGSQSISTGAHTTYDGTDFALSDQACPAGQAMSGVGVDGLPNCTPIVRQHVGAIYRWNTFDTYHNNNGWLIGNDPSLYGGVNPSNWTDNNYRAVHMSSNKEVLRTLLTRKGYGGKNALVNSEVYFQYSSTNGKVTVVLFRIRNTTNADITWPLSTIFTCYGSWSEMAGVAINGTEVWNSGGTGCGINNRVTLNLIVPADRVSSVIVSSPSDTAYSYGSGVQIRSNILAFYNDSLALPAGLEYVDDLDIATGDWSQ